MKPDIQYRAGEGLTGSDGKKLKGSGKVVSAHQATGREVSVPAPKPPSKVTRAIKGSVTVDRIREQARKRGERYRAKRKAELERLRALAAKVESGGA